ncbi:MAG: hypothetical protein RL154_843, partial [Pseudomonadota bacterium]
KFNEIKRLKIKIFKPEIVYPIKVGLEFEKFFNKP